MDTKITLTFYDIVSHLIPGAAFLLSLHYFLKVGQSLPQWEATIYLLVFGYLIGLLFHLVGLLLFKAFFAEDYRQGTWAYRIITILDAVVNFFPLLKVKKMNTPIKDELIKEIDRKLSIDLSQKRLGLFIVADTFVASLPFGERDILAAKEGVYRSLVPLIITETIFLGFFVFPSYSLWIFGGGLVLIELCRYAREYYRTIKNQQVYTLALIKLKEHD